ncbi:MAG: UTP--glucose-1-phosphate uridylyltransferase [Candidatus Saccharibacteria bacterium]|nr:UTP--glucose-1-phosphate uridylyltransferase [Candidatus Saccharibacteria bacterium]
MSTHKGRPVRKAVIAAAGFGTRFLPQTKAMPKEMMPLIDKPVIQYIVEELVDAGVEDIVIVTGYHKRSIEDHFDSMSADLRENLEMGGKDKLLKQTQGISELANFAYIRQKGPYGNGTPMLNAEHLIGDEPFIYTWSDDFFVAQPSRFKQMIQVHKEYGCSVMSALTASSDSDYDRYGFAAGNEISPGVIDTTDIVEKPGKQHAPSNLATVSGFLLTPDVFPYLHKARNDLQKGKELYGNDAIKLMIDDGKRVLTYKVDNGTYYDAGDKLGYLKTIVDFAMEHDELKNDFTSYIREKFNR